MINLSVRVPKDSVSNIFQVPLEGYDSGGTVDLSLGSGKTGLAFNTSNLTFQKITSGGVVGALTGETIATLGTFAAPTSAGHIRFKEIDATALPGLYEVQLPDSLFTTFSRFIIAVVFASSPTAQPTYLHVTVI